MQPTTFSDIATILQVEPMQQHSDPVIDALLTDSRKVVFAEGTLFFALSTSQRNANDFIPALYDQGVRCFIVDHTFSYDEAKKYPEGNFICIANVLHALQAIAADHRHRFNIPVIGITGSNGKTIVKEWLYQLLNNDHNIVRSPKSYNSQTGVPLSVWQMNESHTLAIFEAGISLPNEMGALQKIIDPDIGIYTFSGEAHAEGFENNIHKIHEKLGLFSKSKLLVFCSDDEVLANAINTIYKKNANTTLFKWSKKNNGDLLISKIEKYSSGSTIFCKYQNREFHFSISFTDDASVHNAIICCCMLLHLGIIDQDISARMQQLRPVEMRLELKQGINNCSIINDSYSADINSLNIALDFLSQQQQHPRHTLILSDVLQSGKDERSLYDIIASILEQKKLFRFIGIGPVISSHAGAFKNLVTKTFFESTEDLLKQLSELHFHDETILLKGARVFYFEKISRALEQKLHDTVLEIDLNALRHNFKSYKWLLEKDVKLMAMVKAFSYGSGSFEIANLLQHAGADYLAVAYADEGVELRKAGIRLPIMVMNSEEAGFDNILKHNLEPEIYSFNILAAFKKYLGVNSIISWPVHIKLDTGMHRLGFEKKDNRKLASILVESPELHIRSVFSHLVASNDLSQDDFTKEQAATFLQSTREIEKAIGYSFLRHISNTSAIIRHPSLQMDMVRIGIGLYGVDDNMVQGHGLKNVTTLKTTISQIKKIKKGESVGYGRASVLSKDSTIATVRIGYADGYPRLLGNGQGKMLVNGQLAPVIGNVCMDMTMLDITGIEAAEEDEVIVFGGGLLVSEVAKWAATIPYEILTNISQRVRRVYFEE